MGYLSRAWNLGQKVMGYLGRARSLGQKSDKLP